MGALQERPSDVGEVSVELPGEGENGEPRRHHGPNLDDVLRLIVWDYKTEHGWSIAKTADHLGLKQRTLASFMDEQRKGTTLDTLSKICAALKLTPVNLFRMHDLYRPETREAAEFIENSSYDRVRAVFSPRQARRLALLGDVLNDRGALEKVLDAAEAALGIEDPASRTSRRAAGKKVNAAKR